MNLKEKINGEMVSAAKAKDKIKLSAIRMIKSALHNKEIDLKRELSDEELLQVLSSIVKQRKDSIEQFRKGGRVDLVEKEEKELAVVQFFMPEQLSEEEIEEEIEKAIEDVGAVSIKDMGKVMKVVMPRLTGRADGKIVSDKVKAKLSA
ncbi:MAG: GatB/YqeY domain-containing protein [Planctomycetaceae bacterium]|nr:MAG: GatB/YqeY domain-containing protein [Planctomycetaceae bacterium]